MEWATLAIGLGGLLLAALTYRRNRRQAKALEAETVERKAADEREERRREEQLRLLREQFQRDERRDEELQVARLVADSRHEAIWFEQVTYTVRIRNVGQAAAEDVYVWLAERLPDGTFSGPVTAQHRFGAITPEDGWIEWQHSQRLSGSGGRPAAGAVLADWTDGRGDQRGQDIGPPGASVVVP